MNPDVQHMKGSFGHGAGTFRWFVIARSEHHIRTCSYKSSDVSVCLAVLTMRHEMGKVLEVDVWFLVVMAGAGDGPVDSYVLLYSQFNSISTLDDAKYDPIYSSF